ncbi:DUF6164 family protein [Tahibacter harae]|uniref:DUF6164 family protein n=1 Tax=Tahibacter harae TaxID=2963937 RepID=A0ABT1QNR5_9GAMM|nr:DUF6164 family protein [Tahibacter harae]MCQ4163758.1 DUF6164 family protein [Tahibacter harae]
MPTLLLNLRHVPEDEADEVRRLLQEQSIGFFETPPSRWGVSAGSIWLSDESQAVQALDALRYYQQQRRDSSRAAYEAARRDGSGATLWSELRARPLRLLAALLAAAALVALCALPYFLLRG